MSDDGWKDVGRIVHLPAGGRAVNNPGPDVLILPKTVNNKQTSFRIPNYPSLMGYLRALNLEPIGIDFYINNEQVRGIWPPEWRSVYHVDSRRYLGHDAIQEWRNLVHTAHREKKHELVDIAGRISFHLRACECRLREISEAYHKEIMAICDLGSFNENRWIESQHTFSIYLAVHSYLVDSCTLRDYLAEFAGRYVFNACDQMVKTMAGLKKSVLKRLKDTNSLADTLYTITEPNSADGWLAILGTYRDLVVHSVPLALAERRSFLLQKLLSIGTERCLPAISFSMPGNPAEIASKRSKGNNFSNFEEWIAAIKSNMVNKDNLIDALDYCASVNGKLMSLALELIKHSPVKPEMPQLTDKDIIGPIRFHTGSAKL